MKKISLAIFALALGCFATQAYSETNSPQTTQSLATAGKAQTTAKHHAKLTHRKGHGALAKAKPVHHKANAAVARAKPVHHKANVAIAKAKLTHHNAHASIAKAKHKTVKTPRPTRTVAGARLPLGQPAGVFDFVG